MTTLSYIAKRNIAKIDFSKTALDISIIAADNSINSPVVDVSGLLAGSWVLLVGTAVDDGWHQLLVDSTASKIIINANTTLTDETAGSAITIDGYYHGLDEGYIIETTVQTADQDFKAKTKTAESLSGLTQTMYFNEIETWSLTTGYILEADLIYWREMFSSLRAGEALVLDVYGTITSPQTLRNCILVGDPKISRVGTSLEYTFNFRVRVL